MYEFTIGVAFDKPTKIKKHPRMTEINVKDNDLNIIQNTYIRKIYKKILAMFLFLHVGNKKLFLNEITI